MIEKHLVEILLSAVLLFNVSAYSFLYKKTRDVEGRVTDHDDFIDVVKMRIFGTDIDETDAGHIAETEERFDEMEASIQQKLEEMCQKLDEESEKREQEFRLLEGQMDILIDQLIKEENVDIDEDAVVKNYRGKS
jgi:hypothetical protein